MCTHEVWTYPECGCTIDHHRLCSEFRDIPAPSSCSAPPKHDADYWRIPASQSSSSRCDTFSGRLHSYMPMTKSPVYLPPSPSPTPPDSDSDVDNSDPEDYYHSYLHDQTPRRIKQRQHATEVDTVPWPKHESGIASRSGLQPEFYRQCSINHTTHKVFLEPICDDCLLDELGIHQRSGAGALPSIDDDDGKYEQTGTEDDNDRTAEGEGRGRARHTRNGSGLIWSSDVQIEITPSPTSTNAPAEELPSELVHRLAAASNSLTDPVEHAAPDPRRSAQFDGSVKKRSLPFTQDPNERVSSSIDLARRRPWLVKELEAYLDKESSTKYTAPQDDLSHSTNGKDTEILESSVDIAVLEDSGLNDALENRLSPPVSHSPESPSYRFPSTHFAHARPPSAINTTSPGLAGVDTPPRHRSTLSASTLNADADDESSLHTSSPVPVNSTTLSPNVTQRRPKPRSNTKVVRRRGMDISRSSLALRISSRWGSAERECLRGFKDELLGRSPKHQEKGQVEDSAHITTPYVALGGEHGDIKESLPELDEESVGQATSNGNSKTERSLEIRDDLDHVRLNKGQNDANTAEAGDVADLGTDPSQPVSIRLHRNAILTVTETSGQAESTPTRGRHRSRSPVKNLLTRFAEVQNGGKTWAKGVLGDLKRSLSRDSRVRGRRGRDDDRERPGAGSNSGPTTPATSATPGICTLRAVVDSCEDIAHAQAGSVRPQTTEDAAIPRRGSAQPSASLSSRESAQGNRCLHPTEPQSISATDESWQAHLSHDMALPRRSKKHIRRNAALSKSEVRLPTDAGMERAGPELRRRVSSATTMHRNFTSRSSPVLPSETYECPPEARYYHQHRTGNESEESSRRLLSTSSGPSIPVTASSTSSRTWVGHELGTGSGSFSAPGSAGTKWKGQRLASIVSSSEFEIEDEFIGNTWDEAETNDLVNVTAESPSDRVVGHQGKRTKEISEHPGEGALEATTASGSDGCNPAPPSVTHTPNYHQELPRPRNRTPSSAPTFRFKPHLEPQPSPSKSAQVLTKHPLSTPLRISTPNRPILPTRTSSLSSPPMSTPTRIGLPASKTMLTHSPTEHFACTWRRYRCAGVGGRGGCGRIAKEEVVSCICGTPSSDAEAGHGMDATSLEAKVGSEAKTLYVMEEETLCRSIAPIVRYVGGTLGDWGSGVHESAELSRRTCEQCRVRP